jgi:hypothetical protein
MRNRASAAPIFASPAPPRRSDAPFSWSERLMLRLMGLPSIEEVEERTRNYRGFIASLTPEQIAAMDAYDGPEVLGPANGPKRKF